MSPQIDWNAVKLLVVDNSEHTRTFFAAVARKMGIASDIAPSLDEAMALLEKNKYQIAFVAVNCTQGEGLEACCALTSASPELTAVAMLAGCNWLNLEEKAKEMGVYRHIANPLLPSHFIDCLNECFGQARMCAPKTTGRSLSAVDIFLGRRVLLAEDIEVNRDIVKAMLEETGVEIVEARNGEEACALFEKNSGNFDMILMDIHMPHMDGFTAARTIREKTHIPAAGSIPIIAMTANVFREDIEKCLSAGMNGHIGKPINPEVTITTMKNYLPVR